jgi:hypothetical protein
MSGKFAAGELHPKFVSWQELEKKLDLLKLNGLTIQKETFRREGNYRLIDAECSYCGKRKKYYLDSLLKGSTSGCACQRNRKYGGDPRAEILGERYDCIIQRCYHDSHKQSKDYKGKEIECEFISREHFIKWALAKWPNTDFRGLEFDRIDNQGNYSADNLRLVTSKENHLNRDDNVYLSYKGEVMHWSVWQSPYCPRTTQRYAASGLTGEEIIAMARKASRERRKGWPSIVARLAQLGYLKS